LGNPAQRSIDFGAELCRKAKKATDCSEVLATARRLPTGDRLPGNKHDVSARGCARRFRAPKNDRPWFTITAQIAEPMLKKKNRMWRF